MRGGGVERLGKGSQKATMRKMKQLEVETKMEMKMLMMMLTPMRQLLTSSLMTPLPLQTLHLRLLPLPLLAHLTI